MSDISQAEPGSVVALMGRAQEGDRSAFSELQRIGEERGISFTGGWSSQMVLFRLQDRASTTNLLARAAVEEDLAMAVRELSDAKDGPIEKLLVQRAALCLIDAGQADYEHLDMVRRAENPWDAEVYDRRRDRAQRRLLQVLRTLAEVRRVGRPAVQVNQLSTGAGGANFVKL